MRLVCRTHIKRTRHEGQATRPSKPRKKLSLNVETTNTITVRCTCCRLCTFDPRKDKKLGVRRGWGFCVPSRFRILIRSFPKHRFNIMLLRNHIFSRNFYILLSMQGITISACSRSVDNVVIFPRSVLPLIALLCLKSVLVLHFNAQCVNFTNNQPQFEPVSNVIISSAQLTNILQQ